MSLGTDSANLRNLRTQRVGGASVLFGALFLVSVALAAPHSPFEGVSSEGETGLVGQSGVAQASSWEIDVPAPGVLPPCRPGDVVLVGDSLTVGMQAVGGGEDGIEYIAGGGWRFEHGLLMLTGRLALSGVTTLPENTELVVHLGSNGWGDGDPDEMLAKFVEVAPGGVTFVLPREFSDGSLFKELGSTIASTRAKLVEFAASATTSIRLIDASEWADEADIASDGVHPTADGYRKMADFMIGQICPAGATPLPFEKATRCSALADASRCSSPE